MLGAMAAPLLLLALAAAGDPWWSKPVAQPPLPAVVDEAWCQNPIDRFVLARLEAQGLSPSPRAPEEQLRRRAHLVLTGIVPVAGDRRELGHEERVAALVGSLPFAEHQARHWLDLARFAETHGFEMNQPRAGAWRYRDWVVAALREDMPYGEFLARQVAGDLFEDDAATGFLVAGPWDEVKSPDPVLTAEQRQAELADMANAVSTGFLGLTLACARCHDHKFDPVSQAEYFAFEALFAGVQHGARPMRRPGDAARIQELEEQLLRTEAELETLTAGLGSGLRPPVDPAGNREDLDGVEARGLRFTILATRDGSEPCIDEVEVLAGEVNLALGAAVRTGGDYQGNPRHRPEHLNDGLYGNDRSWISSTRGEGWFELTWEGLHAVDQVRWARDRDRVFEDRLAEDYRLEVLLGDGSWHEVAGGADRLKAGADPFEARAAAAADPGVRRGLQPLLDRRRSARDALANLTTGRLAYAGRFEEPAPTRRLHRGEVTQPREEVRPGLPQALGDLQLATDAPEAERRAALGQWLAAPDNPLAPRVLANRVWAWHFGTGLVATTSDVGVMGELPSHPDLLDWLAAELVASGGSLHHLHRLIATSATWQQASRWRAEPAQADGASRLLWRFPPRRVEAEVLRDSILAVAGALDRTPGGPGFSLFEPNDNYVRNYLPLDRYGPEGLRRMLYATQVRMEREGTFGAFDAPDGGQVCPERGRSTTPLQALALLNSPFVLEQADALAARLRAELPGQVEDQVRRAFLLTLGEEPSATDLEQALDLVARHRLAALTRALFNSNAFLFIP